MMKDFMLQQPIWLLLLLAVLAVGALLCGARRTVRKIRAELGDDSKVSAPVGWHLLLAAVFLVLAVARPVSDPEPSPVYREGRDVIFVLDVSRSMLAQDMAQSRLEMAKLAIRDCLEFLPSGRIGLVLFAGSASIRCPLTEDRTFVQSVLDRAGPGSVSYGSTFLQSAVEKVTTRLLSEKRHGFQDVIFLTDGGDHGEDTVSACAEMLKNSGARLLVVGFGNSEVGSRILLSESEDEVRYLQEDGVDVRVKQERASLRELAQRAGGIYLDASEGMFHLGATYQKLSLDLDRATSDGKLQLKYKERFVWFLMAALLCLFGGEIFGRIRRRSALLLVMLCLGSVVRAQDAEQPAWAQALEAAQTDSARVAVLVEAAQEAVAAGDFKQAVTCYEQASSFPVSDSVQRELTYAHSQSLGRAAVAMLGEDPYAAASMAEQAEFSLLAQRRTRPSDEGVLRDLCCVYDVQAQAVVLIKAQEKADAAMQKQLEELLEILKELVERQDSLVDACRPLRPARRQPRAAADVYAKLCQLGEETETAVLTELAPVRTELLALAEMMNRVVEERLGVESTEKNDFEKAESFLSEAAIALRAAGSYYSDSVGVQGFVSSGIALSKMKSALDLFAGQQSSEEGDSDEEWDDEDSEMSDDWGEGEMDSMAMEGETGRMNMDSQELPEPKFSSEEILQEEAENSEAREQASRAGDSDVKNDW